MSLNENHILDIDEVPKIQTEKALNPARLRQMEKIIRIGSIVCCVIWIIFMIYFFSIGMPINNASFITTIIVFIGLIFPIFFSQFRIHMVGKPDFIENDIPNRDIRILSILGFFGMLISIFWVVLVGLAFHTVFPNGIRSDESGLTMYFLLVVFYFLSIGLLNLLQLIYYPYALNLIYNHRKLFRGLLN